MQNASNRDRDRIRRGQPAIALPWVSAKTVCAGLSRSAKLHELLETLLKIALSNLALPNDE